MAKQIILPRKSFFDELKKLIDLPERVIDLTIHVPLDGIPTVECTYYAQLPKKPSTVTKRFELVEVKGKEMPVIEAGTMFTIPGNCHLVDVSTHDRPHSYFVTKDEPRSNDE